MKKFLAVVGLMMMAGGAMAATSANLVLNVTPTGTKSVTLSTGTINASLNVAQANNIISTGVVVNNAGNVPATYQLVVASPLWTVAGAAGVDTIHMQAEFNSAVPGSAPFGSAANYDLTTSNKTSTASVFFGNQSGLNVAPAANVSLWFDIDMPTALSSPASNSTQALTVTVTAS